MEKVASFLIPRPIRYGIGLIILGKSGKCLRFLGFWVGLDGFTAS